MQTILIQGPQATGKTTLVKILNPKAEIIDFYKACCLPFTLLESIWVDNKGVLIFDSVTPIEAINSFKEVFKDLEGPLVFISNSDLSDFEGYHFDRTFNLR